jgi:hypothetical protein
MFLFLKLIRGNFNIDLVMCSEIPGIARVVRVVFEKMVHVAPNDVPSSTVFDIV